MMKFTYIIAILLILPIVSPMILQPDDMMDIGPIRRSGYVTYARVSGNGDVFSIISPRGSITYTGKNIDLYCNDGDYRLVRNDNVYPIDVTYDIRYDVDGDTDRIYTLIILISIIAFCGCYVGLTFIATRYIDDEFV